MSTNNDYLADIARRLRNGGLTNNQLLQLIAENGGGGGNITPQPNVQDLGQDANQVDVINKVDELLEALRQSGILVS